ncbi:hypothetical protein, partial [Lentimicrobium sp.]|uniref:hypothetical protein n=1 Tax=Lentimicrobium sp. TaxID=2034841 RepID=UPI002BF899CE
KKNATPEEANVFGIPPANRIKPAGNYHAVYSPRLSVALKSTKFIISLLPFRKIKTTLGIQNQPT